jgi:hypothetical protein
LNSHPFSLIGNLDRSTFPTAIKAKDMRDIKVIQVQENSQAIKDSTNQVRKKDRGCESIDGAPKPKIQCQNPE